MQVRIEIARQDTVADDVRRCLQVLYSTPAGTVALDREFGLSWQAVDLPMEAAKATVAAEIIEKTARYEPRARVLEVSWQADALTGVLQPEVRCEIVTD